MNIKNIKSNFNNRRESLSHTYHNSKKLKNRIEKTPRIAYKLIRAVILIALAYQLLYPVLYMISMAVRPPMQSADPSIVWIPKTITLQNFLDAYKAMGYTDVMLNGALLGFGCGLFNIISCSLAGYGFARFKFRGSNLLFLIVIFSLIVPPQTIMLPLYTEMRFFDGYGILKLLHAVFPGIPAEVSLIGNPLTMFMPALLGQGYRAGLYIFMFRQHFKQMPSALEEAAYIDGAGSLKTFIKIMIPGVKNTVITVFLFSFVWQWNEYFLTNRMMGSNRNPAVALSMLRVNIANLISLNENVNPMTIVTRIQAGSLLVILPLLIIYIFTQRFFTDTIENSGVK